MASASIPEQMNAQVLEAYNQPYVFKKLAVPKISDNHDILVKVDAAGYCHTDEVLVVGQIPGNPKQFPHIGSHEFAGTVVAVSDSPSEAAKKFTVGTRVGIPGRGFHPCGTCFECKNPNDDWAGYSFFCTSGVSNGLHRNGGFGEYAVVDSRQVVPLPDDLKAVDAAPLMCAGITIYQALKRCKLSKGQRVGIIGCGGGLGHLGLQFADAMGYLTTGVDAADGPLQIAKSLGTKATIVDARATEAEDVVEQIGKEDGKTDQAEKGLDAVIILPESQASFDYGTTLLKKHGLCVVVSFPERGFRVGGRDLVYRDISVVGTMLGSHTTLQEMVDVAAKHGVRAVKKTFPLEKLNELFAEYKKGGGGKLVVDMSL